MSFTIKYYTDERGRKPVEEFIDGTNSDKVKAKIFSGLKLLQEVGFLEFPYSRKIESVKKLRELRVQFSSNIYRIFYFMQVGREIILLHGFQKKTQKTPQREIDIAEKRMKEHLERRI